MVSRSDALIATALALVMGSGCSSVPGAGPVDAGLTDAAPTDAAPADDSSADGGPTPRFTAAGDFIRDPQGRALVLRGVNIAHTAKRSPDGLPWVTEDDVRGLRTDWGLGVVRLTLFWRFVEPERGLYDRRYLARLREILDWADRAALLVVLDLHQDLFGYLATDDQEGDGPPEWARDPSCPAFTDRSPWFINYFTESVACQFRAFFANQDGVQDAFVAMWTEVAATLGDHPAVVGLDLFNEPWVPPSQRPGDVLGPFYERLIPAVRKAVPRALVFYEPGTLSGSTTDQAPPRPDFDGLVYAPHYYPGDVALEGGRYDGDTAPLEALLARHVATASAARAPLFIGEFGASEAIAGVTDYYRDTLALFGAGFVGFARWSYDSVADYTIAMLDATDGRGELPSTTAMLEPYAERIPGTPLATRVALDQRRLMLDLDAPEGGELIISCPARFCASGQPIYASLGNARQLEPILDPELGQVHVQLPSPSQGTVVFSW